MNSRHACMAGIVLLCCSPLGNAQRSGAGKFSVQKLENKAALERDSSGLAPPRASSAVVAGQANELCQLGQSVPTQIQSTPAGVKPADLLRQLKRIEKLSRQLREEIGPDPLR